MINIQNLISQVPIVPIPSLSKNGNEVFAVLEKYNLTGSIKVKPVYRMLTQAIEHKKLQPGKIILEASSGNTAIALAYLGKILGYEVHVIMPSTTAIAKKRLIQAYGAHIIEVEGPTDNAIVHRDALVKKFPGIYFVPDQYYNEANPDAHYVLTGPHIAQTLGPIDFFVAGLGTAGTVIGAGRYLKEQFPAIQVIAINPSDRIEGLRNFATSPLHIPWYQREKHIIDETIHLSYAESVASGVRHMYDDGYFVGISSAAIYTGVAQYLSNKKNLRGVYIAPDGGDMYLQELKNIV